MLLLRRGTRNLQALPIMPGLVPLQQVTVVNDETRLFAEGVVQGMGNEILDVVAQREIYQKLIADYLATGSDKDREKAIQQLAKYENLPRPATIQARLANEKARLLAQSRDRREAGFVDGMFKTLEMALSRFLGQSRETELRRKIQEASGMGNQIPLPTAAPSGNPGEGDAGESGAAEGEQGAAPAPEPSSG